MKENEKIEYWIGLAEYDFITAGVMLEGRRYLYVGFMCHQVIEKTLKAYFVSVLGDNPPHTHMLIKLAKLSKIYDEMNDIFKDTLDILEPLNIEARYPSYKEDLLKSLSHERCKDILKKTEELALWIKRKL